MLVHNTRQLWTRSLSHLSAMHRRENLPHFARYEKDEGKKACKAKKKKEEEKKKKFFWIPLRLLPCQSGPLKIFNK